MVGVMVDVVVGVVAFLITLKKNNVKILLFNFNEINILRTPQKNSFLTIYCWLNFRFWRFPG